MNELNPIARPYAKAAFEYALEHQCLENWSQLLSIGAQCVKDKKIVRALANPNQDDQTIVDLINSIAPSLVDSHWQNFLTALKQHKRLAVLSAISMLFEHYRADHEKTLDVDVSSAFNIDESTKARLADILEKRFKREISINYHIDPALIGGMIIRAGDTVIDGSARGKVSRLVNHLNLNLKEGIWQQ